MEIVFKYEKWTCCPVFESTSGATEKEAQRRGGWGRLGGYKHALDYLALSAPAFSTPIKGVLFGYQDSSDSNFWQLICLRVNDHIAMILRLPLMSRQTYMQEIVIHSFMSNLHWLLSYDFSFVTERFTIRHRGLIITSLRNQRMVIALFFFLMCKRT